MQMSWRNMQMRKLLLFPPPWRSNYRNWLRAVVSVPTLPSLPSPVLISFATLSVLHCQFSPSFFEAHSAVTGFQLQLLLVSLLSEKSTSLEASYQNLLQQGGWLKLSGMTCGLAGSGGGDKCMANLWNIWIKGRVVRQGHTMAKEKSLHRP